MILNKIDFLSDYFCFAHNKRWNLKNALKRHVVYEKQLSNVAKNFNFSSFRDTELIIEDMSQFIEDNLKFRNEGKNAFGIRENMFDWVLLWRTFFYLII
jgi:hypothetical protein